MSVDFDNSQMKGLDSLAMRSTGPARTSANDSARCSARRLGTSSPNTSDR